MRCDVSRCGNCDPLTVRCLLYTTISIFRGGRSIAPVGSMKGVTRFQDLVAWQLADKLRVIVIGYCMRPAIKKDFKLHAQLADAASSAPKNIAEGFGRKTHREFARFCYIARGSEQEILDSFIEAHQKGYINDQELDRGDHAVRKALKVLNRFIAYLESTPDWGQH
jgi:four helix bundle protein